MDMKKIAAGAVALGVLSIANGIHKGNREDRRKEIERLRELGVPEEELKNPNEKKRRELFKGVREQMVPCCLCEREYRRCELADAAYIFWPIPQCLFEGDRERFTSLSQLKAGDPDEWLADLSMMDDGQKEQERKKLLAFREDALDITEVEQDCFYQEFHLEGGSQICEACAKKLKDILRERPKKTGQVTTYPSTYEGEIPCDRSEAEFIESESHVLKEDALLELKRIAARCGMDIVFGIEYRYVTINTEEGRDRRWIAAGKMAKRQES